MFISTDRLREILSSRLLFVTGKGGVGKSLISAAAACESAQCGKRTLWVEMSESPKGQYYFANYRPSYEPTLVKNNLWAMNLRFQPAIEEYLEIVFRIPFVSRTVARNQLFRAFTTALPGLDALVTTGKIWFEEERRVGRAPYWDQIVVDAPATGHGLALLKFPHAALDIVQSGPIADRARDIDRMLGDQKMTAILVVTLAEELPVDECRDLVSGIHTDTGYRVAGIVVNALYPSLGGPDPQRWRRWLEGGADAAMAAALGSAEAAVRRRMVWLQRWHDDQRLLLPRVAELGVEMVAVPWIPLAHEADLVAAVRERMFGGGST